MRRRGQTSTRAPDAVAGPAPGPPQRLPDEVFVAARRRGRRHWRVLDPGGALLWDAERGRTRLGRLSSYDVLVKGPHGVPVARAQRQPHLGRGWCTFHDGAGRRVGSATRQDGAVVVTGPGGRRARLPTAWGEPAAVTDEAGEPLAVLGPADGTRRVAVRFSPGLSWEWRATLLLGLVYGDLTTTRSR